jgi:hypothetical protein
MRTNPMSNCNESLYCAYAIECQHMAALTRNESERLAWLEMGESWLRLVQVNREAAGMVHPQPDQTNLQPSQRAA